MAEPRHPRALTRLASALCVLLGAACERDLLARGPQALVDAGACDEPGCACRDEGAQATCIAPPATSTDGVLLCARGLMTCSAGTWGSCTRLADGDAGLGTGVEPIITDPTVCNPCHPDCFIASDAPTSGDLSSANSWQISYDPVYNGIRPETLVTAGERGAADATAVCGNGVLESDGLNGGAEVCDDGNTTAGDGCSAACTLETDVNWFCPSPGAPCSVGVCQNGTREGSEACDDGNNVIGDGCQPDCKLEPTCVAALPCTSSCGDGILLPGDLTEECDDGNTRAGDGCSASCAIETGFSCVQTTSSLPSSFPIWVTYRDFIRKTMNGSTRHPDFETTSGSGITAGMVGDTLVGGVPTYTGICEKTSSGSYASSCGGGSSKWQTTSAANFAQWYASADIANVMTRSVQTMTMNRQGTTTAYRNSTFGSSLLPLNGLGWVASSPQLEEAYSLSGVSTNFGFTSEVRHWFQFAGGEVLTFSGDDDVWVFIGGQLALDMGGLHSRVSRTISISAAGVVSCYAGNNTSATSCGTRTLTLVPGSVYEMALFHAERHTSGSNFDLTLNGFAAARTTCTAICGDGITTASEFCDDGANNGLAGYCRSDCQARAAKYAVESSYWRDYTATGTCEIPPQRPLWGDLNWTADASAGGSIELQLRGAETQTDLASATPTSVTLPGTSTSGSFNVRALFAAAGLQADTPYVRVTAVLRSATDQKTAPTLHGFDLTYTCVNEE